MIVHKSGQNCIALYLNNSEIASYGWQDVGDCEARALAQNALVELGLQTVAFKEIETFAGNDCVMIFVSIDTEIETAYFVFDEFETLLCAAKNVNKQQVICSALHKYQNEFYLCVSGMGKPFAQTIYALSEYGKFTIFPQEYRWFLDEHAVCIASHSVFEKLECFAPAPAAEEQR